MKENIKFVQFQSIYDESITLYALERDGVEKQIDGILFVEVTPDFERVLMVRADSLKPVGSVMKRY